jgi:hypothetical protein
MMVDADHATTIRDAQTRSRILASQVSLRPMRSPQVSFD